MKNLVHRQLYLPVILLLFTGCLHQPKGMAQQVAESISLDADFEGSNLGEWEQVSPDTIEFTIRSDNAAARESRWYSFRVRGAMEREVTFRILNAGETSAAGAWRFNAPAVSHDDGATWHRIEETRFGGGVFEFTYAPKTDSDWITLVPDYSFSRWLQLLSTIESHSRVSTPEIIAESLDGRPVHLFSIGNQNIPQSEKQSVWLVGRQHPAETPSSWAIDGLIEWLLSEAPAAEALLEKCSFYIIGFLNPDGVVRGNYRTNSAGLNLNREWLEPSAQAPTVKAAIETITRHQKEYGDVIFFNDVHAHSSIRENFVFYNSAEATSPEMLDELKRFKKIFNQINPDFTHQGGSASGVEGTNARAWGYRALGVHSVTFEASYQDIHYGPNAGNYMTVDQYRLLGADFARAIAVFFFNIPVSEDLALPLVGAAR